MAFSSMPAVLRRRWIVGVGGALVTLAAATGAGMVAHPTYSRTTTELLVPGASSVPRGNNPLAYLQQLSQASAALATALQGQSTQRALAARYPGSTIAITASGSQPGPIITMMVVAPSANAAAGAQRDLEGAFRQELNTLQSQAHTPSGARFVAVPIVHDNTSSVSLKPIYQASGAAGITGLLLTGAIVVLLERWARVRQPKRLSQKAMGRASLTLEPRLVANRTPDDS